MTGRAKRKHKAVQVNTLCFDLLCLVQEYAFKTAALPNETPCSVCSRAAAVKVGVKKCLAAWPSSSGQHGSSSAGWSHKAACSAMLTAHTWMGSWALIKWKALHHNWTFMLARKYPCVVPIHWLCSVASASALWGVFIDWCLYPLNTNKWPHKIVLLRLRATIGKDFDPYSYCTRHCRVQSPRQWTQLYLLYTSADARSMHYFSRSKYWPTSVETMMLNDYYRSVLNNLYRYIYFFFWMDGFFL